MLDFAPMIVVLILLIITMGIVKRPKHQRMAALVYLFLISGWLVFLRDRWTISMIPVRYLGYALGAFGLLGLFGVNIWYGGPLDPRRDRDDVDAEETDGEDERPR